MDYSYIGVGKIYLKKVGSAAGLIEVGNCSGLNLSVNEESKEVKDYTKPGGGTYNEVSRISSVEVSMTMIDLSPENLARALYGSTSAVTSAAVLDEVQTAYKGAFIPLNNIPDASVAPIVTDSAGTTTYVAGTDYEVRSGGIFILTTGTIVDAASIKIDYTKAAANVIEALTTGAQEYELFFDGLNEARSGKSATIRIHRAKLGAAKQIGLIGNDFANLESSGKVLADTSKAAGLSQYFVAKLAA